MTMYHHAHTCKPVKWNFLWDGRSFWCVWCFCSFFGWGGQVYLGNINSYENKEQSLLRTASHVNFKLSKTYLKITIYFNIVYEEVMCYLKLLLILTFPLHDRTRKGQHWKQVFVALDDFNYLFEVWLTVKLICVRNISYSQAFGHSYIDMSWPHHTLGGRTILSSDTPL